MAAALAAIPAIPCSSGSQRLPYAACSRLHEERRPSRHMIRGSTRRERTRAVLRSGFPGKSGLRQTFVGRSFGRDGGQKRRLGSKAGAARAGLPVVSSIPVLGPVLNAFFNPVVLFILYTAGASRFWSGFRRTSYSESVPTKVALTALWPGIIRNFFTQLWLSGQNRIRYFF